MTSLEDIKSLIEHRRVSHYIKALCPFHDDRNTPSLLVYPDYYICLGCGAKGPLNKLEQELRGRRDLPAIPTQSEYNFLPDWSDLDTLKKLWRSSVAGVNTELISYVHQRGLLYRLYKLGWWAGWVTVPVLNNMDQLEGLVLRAGRPQQQRFPTPH